MKFSQIFQIALRNRPKFMFRDEGHPKWLHDSVCWVTNFKIFLSYPPDFHNSSRYLSNNHLVGPFQAVPMKPLPSLYEASDSLEKKMCFEPNLSLLPLSPVSGTIEDFMNEVPQIDEGAFAFIALSGSLFGYPTN